MRAFRHCSHPLDRYHWMNRAIQRRLSHLDSNHIWAWRADAPRLRCHLAFRSLPHCLIWRVPCPAQHLVLRAEPASEDRRLKSCRHYLCDQELLTELPHLLDLISKRTSTAMRLKKHRRSHQDWRRLLICASRCLLHKTRSRVANRQLMVRQSLRNTRLWW